MSFHDQSYMATNGYVTKNGINNRSKSITNGIND
jgi:hypothetical protein